MTQVTPPLCERCWLPVDTGDEFIRLGHITDVRTNGEPVYVWSYLHAYDAGTGGCAGRAAAAA